MLINETSAKQFVKQRNPTITDEQLKDQLVMMDLMAHDHLKLIVRNRNFQGLTAEQIAGILNFDYPNHPSIFHMHFTKIPCVNNAVTPEDVQACF